MPPCKVVSFRYIIGILETHPIFAGSISMTTGTLASRTASLRLCQKIGNLRLVGFHPMSAMPANHKYFNNYRPLLLTFCQCISTHPAIHSEVWPENHKAHPCSSCHQEQDSGSSTCNYHHLWFGKSSFLFTLDSLMTFSSPFNLLNVPPFRGSSPT